MKDSKSLLLVLMSVGLVGTWIYHLYDKTTYSHRRTEVYIKDSVAVAEGIRDSLNKMYSSAISDLGVRLDSTKGSVDSLQSQLSAKVGQINKLRREIGKILNKKGVTKEELAIARQKIAELQQKVDELRSENLSIEEEKKRLNKQMEELTGEISGLQQNMKKLDDENKALTEKINLASAFVASEIRLSPVAVKNSKEEETLLARKASKWIVSFTVQNNICDYSNAEVFIVVTQPDGQVLKNDVWESGTMETRDEGRKNYTQKLRFEYLKGETKQLLFSINSDDYQKGNYVMQLYHNGSMIGKTTKTLQ